MTGYKTRVPCTVRFSDCDMLGHVNNARFITYFEEARVRYVRDAADSARDQGLHASWILASIACNFRAPAYFGEELVACARVVKVGNTSVEFEQAVYRGGEVVAEGRAVIVAMDGAAKTRVPDSFRAAVRKHEGREVEGTS